MLVTFSCKVYEDIVMLGDIAQHLLRMMGESGAVPGALTPDDLPRALKNLEEKLKTNDQPVVQHTNPKDEEEIDINLATRAFPLINMLKAAIEAHCHVMWDK